MRTGTKTVVGLATTIAVLAAAPGVSGEPTKGAPGSASIIAASQEFSAQSPSEYLSSLSPARRKDARLDVELAGAPASDHSLRTSLVESLWQSGRHDEALNLLRTLESEGLVAGIGIGWQRPQSTAAPGKTDVPVDDTGGADEIALDYDPASGSLFAVVRWGNSWGLFVSRDQGVSWSESFHYTGLFLVGMKIDLEIHNSTYPGDYAYVAYSYNASLVNTTARTLIRRFSTSSGAPDDSWGINVPLSDETRNFKEIAIAITPGGSIFYNILRSDGAILCLVGMVTNGSANWMGQTTGVTNADRGLDVAYPGDGSTHISLFISYVDDSDRISLSRRARPTGFIQPCHVVSLPQPWANKTSLAAYLDQATVAWEYEPTGNPYQGVRSMNILATGIGQGDLERTDGGAWYSPNYHLRDPLVAGSDSSTHNAIIYTDETNILYREHDAYTQHWGNGIEAMNEHDFTPGTGDTFAFEWLGYGYGIAYHDSNGDVYFIVRGVLFRDDFECGNLSAWSAVVN